MKPKMIAGNWKMHKTLSESVALAKAIHFGLTCPTQIDVIVAPPLTSLHAVSEVLKDSFINIAAQNIFWEEQGAYTGEVSASQIKDAGARFVIIGHSERRQYFYETNETVNKKIRAALEHELRPIVCIGETLDQRNAGAEKAVVSIQLSEGLTALSLDEMSKVVIAYEPIWAIGTGLTASPKQAEEIHCIIRHIISQLFNDTLANNLAILYGGSVNPSNSKALLSQPNIDGALVGGASLKADDFIKIIQSTD